MQRSESHKIISPRLVLVLGILGAALLILALLVALGGERVATTGSNRSLVILAPAAFLAGALSFLSPCTLPLLPAYFAFTFQARKSSVVLMTVAFFLGLATTLTVLGASATALSLFFLRNLDRITTIGGIAIIAFGVMSLLGKGFTGPQFDQRPSATAIGAYIYGATFALGWTACVGPILGAILTLLATQGVAIVQGALLAFVYALGLGLPLILIATFFSRLGSGTRFWKIIRGRGFSINIAGRSLHLHTTSVISGLLLIVMGYLLTSGQLTQITQFGASTDISLWVIEIEERLNALLGVR
jgi:cytochrome c-type biogenesis protein